MTKERIILKIGKFKGLDIIDVPAYYLVKVYKCNGFANAVYQDFVKENLKVLSKLARSGNDSFSSTISIEENQIEVIDSINVCNKIRFHSRKAARFELNRIRCKNQSHRKPQRIYECSVCNQFHLTSMPIEKYKFTQLNITNT